MIRRVAVVLALSAALIGVGSPAHASNPQSVRFEIARVLMNSGIEYQSIAYSLYNDAFAIVILDEAREETARTAIAPLTDRLYITTASDAGSFDFARDQWLLGAEGMVTFPTYLLPPLVDGRLHWSAAPSFLTVARPL
jgi:hypothetical protein